MTDDKDKVVTLVPKAGDKEAFAAALDELHTRAEPLAKLRWKFYQEHLRAGFMEAQALELCVKVLL